MTADEAIGALDRQIAAHGQPATLRRPGSPPVDVALTAVVRDFRPQDVVEPIQAGDVRIILSPTGVGTWPDGDGPAPPRRGDQVLTAGVTLVVQSASARRIGDRIVRIEAVARGKSA